jgi:ATP-dependent DNA ligase
LKDKFSQKNYFSANDDLFKILDKLINREITGHGSINYINDLINFVGDKYKDEIYYIINKDLKANVNVSLINKISPNSVKEFKVALAERNDEAPQIHQVDFAKGSWMISRKIDGVRVLSLLNNGEVEFYSRTGAQFQTLSTLKEQTKKILNLAKDRHNDDFVLDGECCLIDEDGKDDFSGMMKQITKKNYTVLNPKYIIFDFIKKSEFDSASGKTIFKERMKMLEDLNIESLGNCIQLIPHQNSITKNDYEK